MSLVLSINAVKKALNIPIITEYEAQQAKKMQKKTSKFIEEVGTGLKDQFMFNELKDREKLRKKMMDNAGNQILTKTYKTDPTKLKKEK
jgi:hypothetical protein